MAVTKKQMYIYVRWPTQDLTLQVSLDQEAKVLDLHSYISNQLQLPPRFQKLYFGDTLLESTYSLKFYKLEDYDTVKLVAERRDVSESGSSVDNGSQLQRKHEDNLHTTLSPSNIGGHEQGTILSVFVV